MSKITNDGLTRYGTGCFTAVPIWQQWASKGQPTVNLLADIQTLPVRTVEAITVSQQHSYEVNFEAVSLVLLRLSKYISRTTKHTTVQGRF